MHWTDFFIVQGFGWLFSLVFTLTVAIENFRKYWWLPAISFLLSFVFFSLAALFHN